MNTKRFHEDKKTDKLHLTKKEKKRFIQDLNIYPPPTPKRRGRLRKHFLVKAHILKDKGATGECNMYRRILRNGLNFDFWEKKKNENL